MRIFLDTWVLIQKYKGDLEAEGLLERAKSEFEAHISLITVAELMNVISREYGEREARVQHAYLRRSPLIREPVTEEVARDAGLLKTRYRFSLADAVILSTAMAKRADILLTGGEKQYEKEWKGVTEMQVLKLSDFMKR